MALCNPGSLSWASQAQREQEPPSGGHCPAAQLTLTYVIQDVQEGFVVTQQEHTGGTAGGGWGGLRDN